MVERYIKEYANACAKEIKNNDSLKNNIKNRIIAKINKVVKLRDRGQITIDEAIKMILERYLE